MYDPNGSPESVSAEIEAEIETMQLDDDVKQIFCVMLSDKDMKVIREHLISATHESQEDHDNVMRIASRFDAMPAADLEDDAEIDPAWLFDQEPKV